MSVYRIAICDDDSRMVEQLSLFCREILDREDIPYELEVFNRADELRSRLDLQQDAFHLLILDIQMDGLTGMELARSLRSRDDRVSIIFVTACDDYLAEGYDVQPIHFLLKPVSREVLEKAIRTDLKLNFLPKTVALHIGNKLLHLSIDDIYYAESRNHNVIIHQKEDYRTYYISLTEMEKQLPADHFTRCHNSFLINLGKVQEIGRTELLLDNGQQLPVGRVYYRAFQSAFVRYINL